MNRQKQRKRRKERLIMDAIYESQNPDVKKHYTLVVKDEEVISRGIFERGEMWIVDEYLARVHMRMGVQFFHMLSAKNQALFIRDFPNAFALYGNGNNPGLAVAV